jgi:hypothetical protein
MGYCPDFYPLIKAARYLHVPPWELAQQSAAWEQWALVTEAAELGARAAVLDQQKEGD